MTSPLGLRCDRSRVLFIVLAVLVNAVCAQNAPTLSIQRGAAGSVSLTWTTSGNFSLESRSALGSGAGWEPVAQTPTQNGALFTLVLPGAGQNRYFRLRGASFVPTISWTGAAGGKWSDTSNWSGNRLPGPGDHVLIDIPNADGKIVIDQANITVASLTTREEVELQSGGFQATSGWFAERNVTLSGGSAKNTTFNFSGGAVMRLSRNFSNQLDHTGVNGNVVTGNGALNLRNGFDLNGELILEEDSFLRFQGSQTVTRGIIRSVANSATLDVESGATVSFSPNVWIRGKSMNIGGNGGIVFNSGRISADVPGGHIQIAVTTFDHGGVAEVLNEGRLTFAGNWGGLGEVYVQNGTFNLGGTFGPLETSITKTAIGTVRITGTGDLKGSTLILNAATGSWILDGGSIRNGILTMSGGAVLNLARNFSNALEKMIVNGTIQSGNGALNIRNGLELNGDMILENDGFVRFAGTQTFSKGSIDAVGASATIDIESGATVTFAPDAWLRGRSVNISGNNATLVNNGTISASVADGTMQIGVATFFHEGFAEVLNGGRLSFGGKWSGFGEVSVQNGLFLLAGEFGPLETSISKGINGTVRITGRGNLQGGNLQLNAASGSWILDGGSLRNGSLTLTGGAQLLLARNFSSVLEGMTINGNILSGNGAVNVQGGLIVNGVLALQNDGFVRFVGSQTLSKGTIEASGSATIDLESGATVTFGPGVLVRGGSLNFSGNNATFVNQGAFSADVPDAQISVGTSTFFHEGTAEVVNGARLVFAGKWSGFGDVSVQDGTFSLAGEFGPVETAITKGPNGTVRITGTGDLKGSSLQLNAASGSWVLDGGTLRNGTLASSGGAQLLLARNFGSVLENMTLNGNIVSGNGAVNIRGGFTANGTVFLQNDGFLRFQGTQTFPSGVIEVTGSGATIDIDSGATVTFGPGATVRGGNLSMSGNNATLVNQGKILAELAGGQISVAIATFRHEGIAEVLNNGTLSFGGAWSGAGSVSVQNGTFTLAGTFGPVETAINKGASGAVRISGTGDLKGSTLTLNQSTGSWSLDGGTLKNGTLNLTAGASLLLARNFGNMLESVTINGNINSGNGALNVRGGLALNGTFRFENDGFLRFQDSQTVSAGTFEFAGTSSTIDLDSGATVTLAAPVTIHGRTGNIGGNNATLINLGRIAADVSGGTIRITVSTFTNQGVLEELNGGNLIAPGFQG